MPPPTTTARGSFPAAHNGELYITDQFAWGITACELLVGARPGADLQPLFDAAPRPLADAIARAFAHDADRRHASMAALAALLEPYAERATISREAAAPSPPPAIERRRIRPSYALDAAVIALALAVWLVASGARPQATASPAHTRLRAAVRMCAGDARPFVACVKGSLDATLER